MLTFWSISMILYLSECIANIQTNLDDSSSMAFTLLYTEDYADKINMFE